MNSYNVTFSGDWGSIITTVAAEDEEESINIAREYIYEQSGISWNVLCTMPHVESEYEGEL